MFGSLFLFSDSKGISIISKVTLYLCLENEINSQFIKNENDRKAVTFI